MPSSIPRLTARTVFGRPRADGGIRAYLGDHGTSRFAFYGYGKVAVRDGLDMALADRPDATNVVLPAYLPHGIVEPFREAGIELRYYRCDRTLRPNINGIEALLDGESLAVMLTHYFGHPQPTEDIAAMRGLCEEYDAVLIDDNAHAPLSVHAEDGRLLGTLGDFGITSLRKLLPIPNGAVIFLSNPDLPEDRLTRSGVYDAYTTSDYRYCGRSLGRSISGRPVLKRMVSTLRWLRNRRSGAARDHKSSDAAVNPRTIYEAAKVPMSRLSHRVIDQVDPLAVIAARRANYRCWDRTIRDLDGIEPVFPSLSDGVCPQYYPILVEDPDDLGPLEGVGVSWPPLPREIEDNPDFGTENYLATHLHTLPIHQGLDLRGLRALERTEQ